MVLMEHQRRYRRHTKREVASAVARHGIARAVPELSTKNIHWPLWPISCADLKSVNQVCHHVKHYKTNAFAGGSVDLPPALAAPAAFRARVACSSEFCGNILKISALLLEARTTSGGTGFAAPVPLVPRDACSAAPRCSGHVFSGEAAKYCAAAEQTALVRSSWRVATLRFFHLPEIFSRR